MALVAAGCGGDKKAAKPKVPITTSTAPTTTAVPPPGFPAGAAPLTALPAKPELLHRPVLVVKIDNAPKARPQSGLLQADIVVEEKVEDGVTRFFTMFQSQDAGAVGPVRSARSTDITLVTPLNRPLFAYSGTNATFQKLISAAPLVDVGVNAAAGEYHREGGRPAPYNLFSTTPGLFGHAPAGAGAPPPVFAYRPAGQPSANASATPLGHVHIEYKGVHVTTVVDWTWDPAAQSWLRAQDGGPHKDSAGAQVSAKNVVVQFVDYVDTGQRDRSNTVVPEGKLIGTGEAWVFTDGKLVKGTWSKPTPEAVTSYVDPAGAPIGLTPGQTWVELPPPGSAAV
ncbi:MAG: hypothetical protein QOK43_2250 [Acidimicrobiaceae bacterium]|nr:hypothetical protein [Acidimicrobiaceae bacterium]